MFDVFCARKDDKKLPYKDYDLFMAVSAVKSMRKIHSHFLTLA
ncbi:hypothetical protein [Helicobacter sp.]